MPPETPSARELIRRLAAGETRPGSAPESSVAAARLVCERVHRSLSLWLGATGSQALFSRALTQARATHPALRDIGLQAKADSTLVGVTESTHTHGERAVAAGLEALLAAVLELLGRLIGQDMAARLLEQDVPNDADQDEVVR